MKFRFKLIPLAALLALPAIGFAQAKVGTTGLQFLKVGVGARAFAMGEAFTAVANDASALYYNPGGLIQLGRPEATFTLIGYPAGLKFVYVGGVLPSPQTNGVVGFQVTSLFTDDMVETTPAMPYGTGRTFTAGDFALGISYSQRLTDKFSVGATVKYLNEKLADASASGWSADMGTFYNTGWKRISIGMVIQNFGPDMKFESTPFPLPITFKFGASMLALERPMYNLLVAAEFLHPNDNLELYQIGAEFRVKRIFALRVGKRVNAWVRDSWNDYQEDPQKDPFVEYPLLERTESGKTRICWDGFSAGFGVMIPESGLNLDYSLGGMGTLGLAHRFTINYTLASFF